MSRGLVVPVSCYAAVSLLLPLLRGGFARPEFWRHALVVCGTGALLCAAVLLAARTRAARAERRARAAR